jgi:hypothetical protein
MSGSAGAPLRMRGVPQLALVSSTGGEQRLQCAEGTGWRFAMVLSAQRSFLVPVF